jgi:hypothetical protein
VNCECDEPFSGGPELEVSTTALQYNDVAVGYPQTQVLVISNIGLAGLTLDSLSMRTGDSSPFSILGVMIGEEIDDLVPGSLGPSSSIDLVIEYNPASETASDFDVLEITTNDKDPCPSDLNPCEVQLNGTGAPPNAEIVVECIDEGTCPPPYEVNEVCKPVLDAATNTHYERVLFNFCEVSIGDRSDLSAILRNAGNIPLSMSGFEYVADVGPPEDVNLLEPTTATVELQPGKEQNLRLSYVPSVDGSIAGGIRVDTNDDDLPNNGEFVIRVLGMSAAPDIDVNPTLVRFSEVPVGEMETRDITVYNTGTGTLVIESLEISGGSVAGEFAMDPAEGFSIEAAGQAMIQATYIPRDASFDEGSIVISSNDPDEPVVEVKLEGGAFPDLEVTPSEVEFAGVEPGASAQSDVTLRNVGYANLTISAMEFTQNPGDPPVFEVSGLPGDFPGNPIVLSSAEAMTITITFNDNTMIEDEAGQLAISHDSPQDMDPYNLLVYSSGTPSNLPPVADIDPMTLTIHGLEHVPLDGSGSFDPDEAEGDYIASYSWSFLFKPVDTQGNPSQAQLDSTDQPQTGFMPDIPGEYIVRLVVFDSFGAFSRPVDAEISVNP